MTEQRRRAVAATAAALVFSLVYLRTSERAGRLSQDLTYDDVSYVADAAERLQAGYDGGVVRFLGTFVADPPHSPLQTALAVLGLGAFGFHDESAYVMNALLLVLTALFILHLFREERRWVVALFVGAYLASALAYRTAVEFRPDLAGGMATACFVVLLARGVLAERAGDVRMAGWALAVALLVKPSFVAHTAAIATWLGGLAVVYRWRRPSPSVPVRAVFRALAVGVALASPYYLAHGREVLRYFWSNTQGGEAKLWVFDPALSFGAVLLRFAFGGSAGPVLVGHAVYVSLALCGLALVAFAARRRGPEALLVATLLATGVLSLVIITAGRMENEFFPATFHALVLLGGFLSFSALLRLVPGRERWALAVYAVAGVAAVVASSGQQRWHFSPDVAPGASWNQAVVDAIRADARRRGLALHRARPLPVFVTAAGPVNGTALHWTAQKARLAVKPFDLHRSEALDELLAAAYRAAWVVVPSPGRAEVYPFLPPARMQGAVVQSIRSDPRFRPVAAGIPGDPDRYLVFANEALLDEAGTGGPVLGDRVTSASGFGPEEGPYPEWNLDRVRWLVSPNARVCLTASPGEPLEVRASIRPAVHGTLRVSLGGREVTEVQLAPSQDFQPLRLSITPADSPACLDLGVEGPSPTEPRLVLFRRFDVRSDPGARRDGQR